MDAWIDNVWSTPSMLHFRIVCQVKPGWRTQKIDVAMALEDLDGVSLEHLVDAASKEVDPTRDPRQQRLW